MDSPRAAFVLALALAPACPGAPPGTAFDRGGPTGALRIRWEAALPATSRAWLVPDATVTPEPAAVTLLIEGGPSPVEVGVGEATPRALHVTWSSGSEVRVLGRLTRRDGDPLPLSVEVDAEGATLRCPVDGLVQRLPATLPVTGRVRLRVTGEARGRLREIATEAARYSPPGEEAP